MSISGCILKLFGWKVVINTPIYPKCVICVAPHTSNWDFILGKLAYATTGRKTGFLMKEAWFFFPLGLFFKAIGGIPVPKKKGSELTEYIVDKFNHSKEMVLAVTPEGTRKLNTSWRKGFLYIAHGAKIPILLAYIDYAKKEVGVKESFDTTDDVEADMKYIKNYYKNYIGRYPEKFSAED